jgi:hypothetical protein
MRKHTQRKQTYWCILSQTNVTYRLMGIRKLRLTFFFLQNNFVLQHILTNRARKRTRLYELNISGNKQIPSRQWIYTTSRRAKSEEGQILQQHDLFGQNIRLPSCTVCSSYGHATRATTHGPRLFKQKWWGRGNGVSSKIAPTHRRKGGNRLKSQISSIRCGH